MQVALRQIGECLIRRADSSDLISVMEINLQTLPEHYSDYFYESLLGEAPEAFLVGEIPGKVVAYIICKIEYGFSNFKKLGFVKKGHVVSVAVYLNLVRKFYRHQICVFTITIVGGILGVISWVGYTMATTKASSSSIIDEDK